MAHDCLVSVPLAKEAALALVDAIEPYMVWQSGTNLADIVSDPAYKDPPADYFYPPHDIFAYLASVKTNLQNDQYANEYEFQQDLYQIWARSHDGHFVFYPDLLTKAFEWARQLGLVSISKDGSSLPEIKTFEDVLSSPSTASVVTKINGVDAVTYVGNLIYQASLNQDADAAYNSTFFKKVFNASGIGDGYFSSGGRARYVYPSADTTFTFANGTVITLNNIAMVKGDFAGVVDGPSFFTRFCNATGTAEPSEPAVAVKSSGAGVVAPGYPTPIEITLDGVVSGYYLNGTGYEDVAVMSLLSFESEDFIEFQQIEQKFLADAVRDGKTKLIVDLSANGYILQGYDLFRQLFPSIIQGGYTRWRESDIFLTVAEIFSAQSANFTPISASVENINQYEATFNKGYDLNFTNQPFLTFEDKFAPHVYKGDNYTDPLTTSDPNFGVGTNITGFNSRTNFTQPFLPENIILLLDGFCASICTIFTEFMRTQAGVKSIAMGGRPTAGLIQGVGGIKGAESLGWSNVLGYAKDVNQTATPDQEKVLARLTDIPISRSSSSGLNVRDNILPDHVNDGLPAQYVVEYSECRLYYTEPMVTDVTATWRLLLMLLSMGRNALQDRCRREI
ncbi:uncharacterized protein K444DRAFT_698937 [Hyaloscypha bicolor E]|uniref:CPAF-like PDZ domain-containing protein n=1 Tax=Hyaloscypha bicolor E TaxID=1095630 RepID=A0A2J6TUS9_9HELO|nr:uncharacterized protein K444DRAFT_698937 [Hyaloscypha bicolor E]PMD66794.1 hypothetical protein K444DRAFT_698937 [Hyaloscypha bicolor E]